MYRCNCKHPGDEVIACTLGRTELGVFVDRVTGRATNRWEDGVAGVSEELQAWAEEDDGPVCPDCKGECEWIPMCKADSLCAECSVSDECEDKEA